MKTKNYIRIKQFSPFYAHFMFFDTADYLADDVFIKNNLPVKFSKKEMTHPEWPYKIVLCKVKKKDIDIFVKSMEDLANKMLISGYPDYINFCNTLVSFLESNV